MKAPRSQILEELLSTEEGRELFHRMRHIPKDKVKFRWKGDIYTYYKNSGAYARAKRKEPKQKPKSIFRKIWDKILRRNQK